MIFELACTRKLSGEQSKTKSECLCLGTISLTTAPGKFEAMDHFSAIRSLTETLY